MLPYTTYTQIIGLGLELFPQTIFKHTTLQTIMQKKRFWISLP